MAENSLLAKSESNSLYLNGGADGFTFNGKTVSLQDREGVIALKSDCIEQSVIDAINADLDGKAKRYEFATLGSNEFAASDGMLYSLDLTAEQAEAGVSVTLPAADGDNVQDFVLRIDATAGATQIASIADAVGSDLAFDWPNGSLMTKGALAEGGVHYVAFTRVSADRWSIGYYEVAEVIAKLESRVSTLETKLSSLAKTVEDLAAQVQAANAALEEVN